MVSKPTDPAKEVLFGELPDRVSDLDTTLNDIRTKILAMEAERGQKLLRWLLRKVELVVREDSYLPGQGPFFKRADIAHVDFGFNIGSELGGPHFAIVLYAPREIGIAVVVPLSSQKPTTSSGVAFQVNLGELLENGKVTLAWVQQIRVVSKLRMTYTDSRYKTKRVPGHLMAEIDRQIFNYTHRGEELGPVYSAIGLAVDQEAKELVREALQERDRKVQLGSPSRAVATTLGARAAVSIVPTQGRNGLVESKPLARRVNSGERALAPGPIRKPSAESPTSPSIPPPSTATTPTSGLGLPSKRVQVENKTTNINISTT